MATTETTNHHDSNAVVEAHRNRVCAIRNKLKKELENLGHQCDEDLRLIDKKPAMVFILPSNESVYIGFGPTGSRQAFRGLEKDFDVKTSAETISAYIKELPDPTADHGSSGARMAQMKSQALLSDRREE